MEATTADDLMKEELERMRARLLDLSARNPLLNYRNPRASSLRVVDEVPALVLESMVNNGGFRFAALESDKAPAPVHHSVRRAFGRKVTAAPELFYESGNGLLSDDPALLSQSDQERREAAKGARARREEQILTLAQELGIDPSRRLWTRN
jgi:hypothetical protein